MGAINVKKNKIKTVQAVDRSLMIIEALAQEEAPVTLSTLSRKVGLNVSTVHRLLSTLINRGFAEQDPYTGRYKLGLKVFRIGIAALYTADIRSVARPHLKKLIDQFTETVNLAILDEGEVM